MAYPEILRSPFSFELLQATGGDLRPGHRVELLENGAVLERLLALIARARESVHLTVFMWAHGEASRQVVAALAAARARGVRCRVALDAVGSRHLAGDLRALREAGCEVRLYRAPLRVGPRTMLERSHRKIAVIDGRVALTGGFGIRDVWLGDGLDPRHWRDSHVQVEGPAVRRLQLGFADVWGGAGGELLGPEDFPELPPAGEVRAAFIRSQDTVARSHARQLLELLARTARQRLWLATGYFAPGADFRRELVRLAGAGVDVRILMPGRYNDVKLARLAQRFLAPGLARRGVRIFEYQPSMLHRKVALVDDALATIGSINLDFLSFRYLEEGSLLVQDKGFAGQIAQSFERDFGRSREVEASHRAVFRRHGRVPRALPAPQATLPSPA